MRILGVKNLKELFFALYGEHLFKNYAPMLILTTIFLSGLTFISFIEDWVWSPFYSLMFFWVVILLDWVLAVFASKTGLETNKSIKFGLSWWAYNITFAVAYIMPKILVDLGMSSIISPEQAKLASRAYFLFCLIVNLLSVVKHMSRLGLLPKKIIQFLDKYLDIHKNAIEKTMSNELIQQKETPGVTEAKDHL